MIKTGKMYFSFHGVFNDLYFLFGSCLYWGRPNTTEENNTLSWLMLILIRLSHLSFSDIVLSVSCFKKDELLTDELADVSVIH